LISPKVFPQFLSFLDENVKLKISTRFLQDFYGFRLCRWEGNFTVLFLSKIEESVSCKLVINYIACAYKQHADAGASNSIKNMFRKSPKDNFIYADSNVKHLLGSYIRL